MMKAQKQKQPLLSKEELLIENLLTFFSVSHNLKIFRDIAYEGKFVSLRLLDWFATNYSKAYQVWIHKTDIYKDYKQNLKGYKKQYFDPFCRRKRVYLRGKDFGIKSCVIDENHNKTLSLSYGHTSRNVEGCEEIQTTVGQLNFFRWLIQKQVIKYILDNHNAIETHMGERKSTKKICESRCNTLQKKSMKFTIYFL